MEEALIQRGSSPELEVENTLSLNNLSGRESHESPFEGLKSHPIDMESRLPEQTFTCRICWGEADEETGGDLVTPCNCSGTARHVHARCLTKWVNLSLARKSYRAALCCDICRSTYHLPPTMAIRDRPSLRFRRFCTDSWTQALRGPFGPVIRGVATSAWVYSTLSACYGAATYVGSMPRLLVAARQDPRALRPLLPLFAAATLLEPLLSTSDLLFHAETLIFYSAGWLLDAAARLVEMNVVSTLPPHLQPIAMAALCIPKGIGLAFQALDLSLMCLFGGGAAGFAHGIIGCLAAPFQGLAMVARGGASFLGFLAVGLAHSARAAGATASFISRGSRAP